MTDHSTVGHSLAVLIQQRGHADAETAEKIAHEVIEWLNEEMGFAARYDDPTGVTHWFGTSPPEPEVWYRDQESMFRLDVEPDSTIGLNAITSHRRIALVRAVTAYAAGAVERRATALAKTR